MERSLLYPRSTKTRTVISLDGMWKFCLDPQGEGEKQGWPQGIPGHEMIPVPASFNDFYTDKDIREYTGDFWYETTFDASESWRDHAVDLRIGALTHRGTVYLNGQKIVSHEGGYLPFVAHLNDAIIWNGKNRIVIKGNNELSYTSLPAGMTKTLSSGKKMTKPFFHFFNYAGLNRSVKLLILPAQSILDYTVNHRLADKQALVDYEVISSLEGGEVEVRLYDEEGYLVASSQGDKGTLQVEDPHLWEVRQAYLYHLVIDLKAQGQLIDEYEDEIGIRTFRVENERFLLNDHPVYLKGFGKHEDSDVVGRGTNMGMIKRDFELMKWIGANSFRTSHYPYSEEIYQLADREGFLVIDELPAVGFFESLMNFLDASGGKSTQFFERETIPELKKNHLDVLYDLVLRDKNHACVIAWSLFNEPETSGDSVMAYFKDIFDYAAKLDVQKRPRTFALVMNSKPGITPVAELCDFISLNRYYGWYLLGGFEMEEARAALVEEMDAWVDWKLNKPIIFTEYGCDHLQGEFKLPSVQWSVEYEIAFLKMYEKVFDHYACVQGEQIWNFADFQTVEGIMRVNGNKKGVFTRDRQPKLTAYHLKERWEKMPDSK